jgi:hypothetical protein
LLACMQVQQSGNRWYMNHDFSAMWAPCEIYKLKKKKTLNYSTQYKTWPSEFHRMILDWR